MIAAALAVGAAPAGAARNQTVGSLALYYTNPVLVRAGEVVQMPIDVVCATMGGDPCGATVTLGTRVGETESWTVTSARGTPGLRFEVSAPASRAIASAPSGSVSFYFQAEGPNGGTVSIPDGGASSPLSFYVTTDLPLVAVPAIPFGKVEEGTTALFLPWGSGRMRAGLVPGAESATLGPSSFDVDAQGRIYVADGVQDRLATFSGGRLTGEVELGMGARPVIAVASDGAVFVAGASGPDAILRRVGPDGVASLATILGPGIVSEVRSVGARPCVRLLPVDAWTVAPAGQGPSDEVDVPTTGRPLASGRSLIRVGGQDSIRLGYVSQDRVEGAIELRFSQRLGEVALAEPDGSGGFWVVARVWRDRPVPAYQFQAVHVASGAILSSFAVGDPSFANTPPMSRFRLGGDGNLYEMTTSPDGMRIVRYDLEVGR